MVGDPPGHVKQQPRFLPAGWIKDPLTVRPGQPPGAAAG
jgi:hypothetical protein